MLDINLKTAFICVIAASVFFPSNAHSLKMYTLAESIVSSVILTDSASHVDNSKPPTSTQISANVVGQLPWGSILGSANSTASIDSTAIQLSATVDYQGGMDFPGKFKANSGYTDTLQNTSNISQMYFLDLDAIGSASYSGGDHIHAMSYNVSITSSLLGSIFASTAIFGGPNLDTFPQIIGTNIQNGYEDLIFLGLIAPLEELTIFCDISALIPDGFEYQQNIGVDLSFTVSSVPVPEPTSMLLFSTGVIVFGRFIKKKVKV